MQAKESLMQFKNLEMEKSDLKEKIESLESELQKMTKKQCPYPGCNSSQNFRNPHSKRHYCLESCPNWNEVSIYF
jgi:hypothetical protein